MKEIRKAAEEADEKDSGSKEKTGETEGTDSAESV